MKKIIGTVLALMLFVGGMFCFSGCVKKQKDRIRYEIVAEYRPSDQALTGTVKVDFFNAYDVEIDCLKFQLYPNAYRENSFSSPIGYDIATETFYAGKSYGEISISSALGGVNYEISGEDKNILSVYLLKPLAPEEHVVLDIGFTTKIPKANHCLGVTKSSINLVGAFPTLCAFENGEFVETLTSDIAENFYGDCADYAVQLTLPKDYRLACTGEIEEEKTLESKKRYTVSATNARGMAFVVAEDYRCLEAHTGKTTLQYYHFDDADAEEVVKLARQAIEFYSSVFGEYPYTTMEIVQSDIVRASGGHSGLHILPRKLSGDELIQTVLLSVASDWWSSAVGVNREENAWLSDGLNAYSVALFLEKYPEYGITKESFVEKARKEYCEYKEIYQKALGWVDTRMNRSIKSFLNVYEYNSIAVKKSLLMFAELEKGIGRKKMLAGLRKYYAENVYSLVSPANLVGAFERIGANVDGFFAGYLEGKGTF